MPITTVEDPLARSWLRHLWAAGRSPRTVEAYEHAVATFSAAFGRPLTEATRADVEEWLASMRDAGLAPATLRHRLACLRAFFKWAVDEEEVDRSPCPKLGPAVEGKAPRVLADDEVAKLLAACAGNGFKDRRDRAIVSVLASTGMRRGELVGIELDDVDLDRRLVSICGKGRRFRVVRLSPEAARDLDRYLRVRGRHAHAASTRLWLSQRGALTARSVEDLLRSRARRAGIDHVHAHMLRHRFAHRFLMNGGQEGDLQVLGGWSSTRVMSLYGRTLKVDRALAAYDAVMG